MRTTADVHVTEHLFAIVDLGQTAVDMPDWTTGLIGTMAIGAQIYTGIHTGLVRVTTEILQQAPTDIDIGNWDDVVEATLTAQPGQLRVHALEYGPYDEPPALPILSPAGAGTYRLRGHVRGRDDHYDALRTEGQEPAEHYLLSVWPAAPTPSLIIRATDRCGYSLRVANLQTQPRPDQPPTPTDPNKASQRNRLIQAQREATGHTDPPTAKPR